MEAKPTGCSKYFTTHSMGRKHLHICTLNTQRLKTTNYWKQSILNLQRNKRNNDSFILTVNIKRRLFITGANIPETKLTPE